MTMIIVVVSECEGPYQEEPPCMPLAASFRSTRCGADDNRGTGWGGGRFKIDAGSILKGGVASDEVQGPDPIQVARG